MKPAPSVVGVVLAVSVAVGAACANATGAGLRGITVDATIPVGVPRPFSGIHGAHAAEFAGRSPHDVEAIQRISSSSIRSSKKARSFICKQRCRRRESNLSSLRRFELLVASS